MRPLVVLRPEPGATATCEAARNAGLRAISMPLFHVEAVEWTAPEPHQFDALLLTSANALQHGGSELAKLRDLPAHAVGEATATAARNHGFAIGVVGSDGVDSLLDQLDPALRLLHVCGEHRRQPTAPRQSLTQIPVYRAPALPPPENLDAIAGAVVAVHSPRAGKRLAQITASLERSRTSIVAISGDAAEAAGRGWKRVEVASEPSDPALLALAAQLCNNPEG